MCVNKGHSAVVTAIFLIQFVLLILHILDVFNFSIGRVLLSGLYNCFCLWTNYLTRILNKDNFGISNQMSSNACTCAGNLRVLVVLLRVGH